MFKHFAVCLIFISVLGCGIKRSPPYGSWLMVAAVGIDGMTLKSKRRYT